MHVYIPHSSDKTLHKYAKQILQIPVYIPHSSDKTQLTLLQQANNFQCLHPS